MKHFFRIYWGVLFFVSTLVPGFAAERTIWIPLKPDPPPAVDADLVEWGNIPGRITIGAPTQAVQGRSNWTGPEDLSGEIGLAWRQEGLYVSAQVRDDRHRQSRRGESLFNGDHIEIFIDREPGKVQPGAPFNASILHLGLSPGRLESTGDLVTDAPPEVVVFTPAGGSTDGFRIAARKTDAGYTLEAFIPAERIGILPAAGTALGLEIALSDADSDKPAQESLATIGTEAWAHVRTRMQAAVLARSDGKPVPLTQGTAAFEGFEIPVGEKQEIAFPVPPWPEGVEPVLAFPARLDFSQPGGYTQAMKVKINGTPVMLKRLLNKEETEERADGSLSSTAGAGGDLFTIDYSSDFDATDSHPTYALKRKDTRSSDFVFSASGLITVGTNTLVFENSIRSPLTNALVIGPGRIEFRPPIPSKSEAGPPTGSIPTIAPRGVVPFTAEVAQPSENVIRLGFPDGSVDVVSHFSTPDGQWQTGSNAFFTFSREIVREAESILVRDSYSNQTEENLPLIHRHQVKRQPERIWLAGLSPSGTSGSASEPQNPTAFAAFAEEGIGLMALDDVFQVHVTTYSTEEGVGLADNSLVLQPGASYTAEWAIFPVGEPNYFAFVNAARRLRGVNFTIEGSFAFLRANPDLTGQWTDQQLVDFARFKSAKYLCSTIDYPMLGPRYPHGTAFQYIDHSARIAHIQRMRKLVPEAEHLVYYHCFIDVRDEAPVEFADARLLKGDGTQANYGHETDRIFIPTVSNSYGREVRKNVDLILGNIGADGVYWDELEYSAYHYHYGEPWDGVSADVDPKSFKISQLKSSVTLVTQPWRLELAKEILAKGPLIANGSPHTRTMMDLHFPRFVETGSISACAKAQLYTPIALGDHLTEQSEEDAYRVMLRALDYGCVYYWYNDMTVIPTHSHVTQYMFPITPIELGPGYILGKERILTRKSGIFGWGDGSQHEVHLFDPSGREAQPVVPPTIARTSSEDGKTWTEIRLGEGWSAAVIRK